MSEPNLDDVDLKILEALQDDGRITNAALSAKVNLSPSPCLARVRALERDGVISRYVALLDPRSLGLGVSVFIQVTLDKQVKRSIETFEGAIRQRSEVMECYLMTGDSDYLLRVVVADVPALQRFILDELTTIPGIASIRSSFALKQVKYQTALPLLPTYKRPKLARNSRIRDRRGTHRSRGSMSSRANAAGDSRNGMK